MRIQVTHATLASRHAVRGLPAEKRWSVHVRLLSLAGDGWGWLADLSLRVATRAWRVLPVFASLTLTRLPLFLPARRPRPTRADTAGDRFSRWSRWSTTCGKHRSPGLMGLMGPASALDTRPGFEFPNILGQNV